MDNAVEKVKQKMVCEVVKSVIKKRLNEELSALRPEFVEGIATRICADVQEVFVDKDNSK